MNQIKKYLPFIVLIAIIGIGGYFALQYIQKMNDVSETATRVLNNAGLRDEATRRAQRNGTTLQTEAQKLAREIANNR